eukprot:5284712-Prymnesium_polylepis.2
MASGSAARFVVSPAQPHLYREHNLTLTSSHRQSMCVRLFFIAANPPTSRRRFCHRPDGSMRVFSA